MNTILHEPKNIEQLHQLKQKVSAIYAQTVAEYLQKLPCPEEQKTALILAVESALQQKP